MDYFYKIYYEFCNATFPQYGLKKKNKAYVGVVNDVMQNFTFEELRRGRTCRACRVEFAIIPLCLRIEKEDIPGGVYSYNLKLFEEGEWMQRDQWEYDPKSEESMEACAKDVIRYLTYYLLPLFERANSCETALPELINVEKLFNDNRVEFLRKNGLEDRAKPGSGFQLSNCVYYYMALKNGDFYFALKSRKALLQQNVDSYNSMSERGYLTEKNRIQREIDISKLRDEIAKIERQDKSYINQLIIENETYSWNNLKAIIK